MRVKKRWKKLHAVAHTVFTAIWEADVEEFHT